MLEEAEFRLTRLQSHAQERIRFLDDWITKNRHDPSPVMDANVHGQMACWAEVIRFCGGESPGNEHHG